MNSMHDVKRLSATIESISFQDGSKVSLSGNDFIVFAGANNTGKSRVLKELHALMRRDSLPSKIVTSITMKKNYDGQELWRYCEENFLNGQKNDAHVNIFETRLDRGTLSAIAGQDNLSIFAGMFVYHADTENRLSEVRTPSSFDTRKEMPTHPIQVLFSRAALEQSISQRFREAFNQDLIVDRAGSKNIPVYVGERPDWTKENDRVSEEYLAKLRAMDTLDEQGDGMRAFAGLLARTMTFDRSILLIDEPEAFLHPPQARLMGRFLAEEQKKGVQIFVSTHSRDIIQGIIEARPTELRFSRLTRSPKGTSIRWLDESKTSQFLRDPLLRTTNTLDAVFHQHVAFCEGDRDCVFYKELLQNISTLKGVDCLFVNTNGKDRMPDFATALTELGIDPIIIADIDLIRSSTTLSRLITAKGGNANLILSKASRIAQLVEEQSPTISASALKAKIASILDGVEHPDRAVTKEAIRAVNSSLKAVSPFDTVKRAGFRALPSGEAQTLYAEISEQLSALRIWLVPEGELEGFLRSAGRKGRDWFEEAMSRDFVGDPDLHEARKFISDVFGKAKRGGPTQAAPQESEVF